MNENHGFVVCQGDYIVSESFATDSINCILRFFQTDGFRKYIDRGWLKAKKDGYEIKEVEIKV